MMSCVKYLRLHNATYLFELSGDIMSKGFPKGLVSYLLDRVNEKKKHTDFTTSAHVTSFNLGKMILF